MPRVNVEQKIHRRHRFDIETLYPAASTGQMVVLPATVGINAALPGVSEVFKTVRLEAARRNTSHSLVRIVIETVTYKTEF